MNVLRFMIAMQGFTANKYSGTIIMLKKKDWQR